MRAKKWFLFLMKWHCANWKEIQHFANGRIGTNGWNELYGGCRMN